MSAIQTSPASQAAGTALKAGAALLDSTDGLSRVSEFAMSIFSMFEHFFKTLPDALSRLGQGLATFVDLTAIVSIVKRCRDWIAPDAEGKRPWDKAWDSITALTCLTASQVISFVKFLSTTLKLFELGKAFLPLSIISNGLTLAFSAFDMVGNAKQLANASKEKAKAERAQAVWANRAGSITEESWNKTESAKWSELVEAQCKRWDAKVHTYTNDKNEPKLKKAEAKLQLWTNANNAILAKTFTPESVKSFCNRKVEQLKIVAAKSGMEKIKSILSIAWNVGLIALLALSSLMVFIAPPAALVVATIAVAVATSGLDVANFLLEHFINSKEVPVVTV